jgi:uncharacterized protein YegL
VRFPNGQTSTLKHLDSSWSIADLVHQLRQRNILSSEEVNALQSLEIDLQQPIPSELDFSPQSAPKSTPHVKPRMSISDETNNGFSPQQSNSNISSSGGLKKKSPSPSSKGGLKKKNPVAPERPPIPPIHKPDPVSSPKKPILIKPPISVLGRKTYTIDQLCSKNKSQWHATLLGETEPSKSKPPATGKASQSIGYNTIHIILDDSSSMQGTATSQLKSATRSFLNDRPKSDSIHLTVISKSWSHYGSPNEVVGYVNHVTTDFWTPMKARFEALAHEINASKGGVGDVVLLFTDGDSTDGSPISAAKRLKESLGARIICIGCGPDVDKSVMQKMASSKSDYHHAKSAAGILQAFQAVAQSLGQQTLTVTSSGKGLNGSIAKQISSANGSAPSSSSSNYTSTSKLDTDLGFEIIRDYSCFHCQSDIRTFCPSCNSPQCAGASKSIRDPHDSSKNILSLECGSCNTEFHIKMVDKLHQQSTTLGGKKGK